MVNHWSLTSKPRRVSCGPQVYRAIIVCWCDAIRKATYGFGWAEMKRTIPNEHRRQVPLCLDAPLGSWPSHTPSESTTAGRLAVRSFLSDTGERIGCSDTRRFALSYHRESRSEVRSDYEGWMQNRPSQKCRPLFATSPF